MPRHYRVWMVCVLYVLMGAVVVQSAAQPSACTALVTQALQAVGQNCEGLGRNTACYGFDRVEARFASASTAETVEFGQPADQAPLLDLIDLRTAPLDLVAERWGIAVLNVQANIPNTLPGQAVTFMLLGDAQVQNDVPADQALTVEEPVRVIVTAGQRVNLRGGPATTFNIVANADPGQPFDADARSADGQWVRLAAFDAWLSRSLVAPLTAGDDLNALPVADLDSQSPMQAFYFRTGIGVPTCAEAPDVLVLQGPEAARVRLSVNGAEVELGSTAVLRSATEAFSSLSGSPIFGGLLEGFDPVGDPACLATEISLIEGDAVVNTEGAHVPLGHRSRSATCLSEDGAPVFTSPWSAPERLTGEQLTELAFVEALPLPRDVSLPTEADIDASVQRGPNVKPEPTRLPVIARPTRVAPTADPSRPVATRPAGEVTAVPDQNTNQPSCDTFAVTAPFGPVGSPETFYWNQARNVAAYQIEMSATDDGEFIRGTTQLFRVGATESNITVDVFRFFQGNGIQWKVQVLVNDASGNLTTLCESPYYLNDFRDS